MQTHQKLIGPRKTVIGTNYGLTTERAIGAPELISLTQTGSALRIPIAANRETARQGQLASRHVDGAPYITSTGLQISSEIK